MLPPVNAVVNASISYQDHRASQEDAGRAAAKTQGTPLQAAIGVEQNNAIAGRLNILLLSGQERMSENFATLVTFLGKELRVERAPGETISSYAGRLVQALADLPPQARQALQRQLAQMFNGLQLRTLMGAFRNPAGPEAATLAIYLEFYRAKDRGDLAARTVVTSYRQNGGEVRSVPLPSTVTAAGRNGAAAIATGNLASGVNAPKGSKAAPSNDPLDAVARGRIFSGTNETANGSLAAAAMRAMERAAQDGAEFLRGLFAAPEALDSERTDSAGHKPQAELSQAAGQFGEDPDPSEIRSASSADGLLQPVEPEAADAEHPMARSEDDGTQPVIEHERGSGAVTDARAGTERPVSQPGERALSLLDREEWKTVTVPDENGNATILPTEEEIFPDPAELLDFTQADEAKSADPADFGRPRDVTSEASPRAAKDDVALLEQSPEPPSADGTMDARSAAARSLPLDLPRAEEAGTRLPAILREGVPLPMVNYLFADDDFTERPELLNHRFGGGQGEGEADGDDSGEAGDEQAADEPGVVADEGGAASLEAMTSEQSPTAGESESPNDLYWRMAGWS
ncbi:hypothetical protein HHL25_14695 [Rhizobium sp. S-51]|uniref:Uncharacterized protein n=1 Tax=Rhizobium terricola TaxID=2728849 RepID=A0A7Y0FWZ3_9HYPH|nr:hypothetical protein [Rhizobium terricola]NML75376.1 hypothetical protein [Rhizobium terricola]